MDEGSGVTAADSGGGGHNANLSNDGQTPAWVAEGLSFNGDFLDILGWAPDLSSGYTVQAAVQLGAGAESTPGFFMMCDGADRAAIRLCGNNTSAEIIYIESSSSWVLAHNRKTSVSAMNQTGSIGDGQWHLITFVHDGANGRFYKDEVALDVAEAVTAPTASVANVALGIGAEVDSWDGKIGIIKLNSVALSASELAQDAAYIKSVMGGRGVTLPFDPSLVAGSTVFATYGESIVWDSEGNVESWG
jgi:hypothetical protein